MSMHSQHLGDGADLVEFDQNRVGQPVGDAFLEDLRVRNE